MSLHKIKPNCLVPLSSVEPMAGEITGPTRNLLLLCCQMDQMDPIINQLLMAYCYIHKSLDLSTVVWEDSICKRCRLMQKPKTGQGTEKKILQNVQSEKSHLYHIPIFWRLVNHFWRGSRHSGLTAKKEYFLDAAGKMSTWTHSICNSMHKTVMQAQERQNFIMDQGWSTNFHH